MVATRRKEGELSRKVKYMIRERNWIFGGEDSTEYTDTEL